MGIVTWLVRAEPLTVAQSLVLLLTPRFRWLVCSSNRQPVGSAAQDSVKFEPVTDEVMLGSVWETPETTDRMPLDGAKLQARPAPGAEVMLVKLPEKPLALKIWKVWPLVGVFGLARLFTCKVPA